MESRITKLFDFLKNKENRKHCIALQNKYRERTLRPFVGNKSEMVYALLHDTFFTQSQPKLDKAQVFFEKMANNRSALESFKHFCELIGEYDAKKPYLSLYKGLEKQPGWGGKTSALFVKNVYHVHNLPEMQGLKFWDDVPPLQEKDMLYLPVDAVIKDIFPRFVPSLNNFSKINKYLRENHSDEMDVWDDLWFWGFITQKGSKSPRKLGFNKGKYWVLLFSDKDPKVMKEIERKCEEFISLIPQ